MSQSATEPAAPSGVLAAVRKFSDLLAFLLLGYVALEFLLALGRLLVARKGYLGIPQSTFSQRAAFVDSSFLSLLTLAAVVAAVVLVIGVGQRSKLARPVVIIALALLAFGALLGLITMLASLFTHSSYTTGRDKAESLLGLLVVLAIYVVVGLVLLAVLGSAELRPAPKPQRAYGQYSGGQQGGQQGYGGYPPAQPAYGYHQPQGQYDSQPTYQPPAPAYDQPPPGVQQHGQPYESAPPIWEQPATPPPAQPAAWPQPQAQPQAQPQQPQQPSPQQQPPGQPRWPEDQ